VLVAIGLRIIAGRVQPTLLTSVKDGWIDGWMNGWMDG
jgi:hypothetical protein